MDASNQPSAARAAQGTFKSARSDRPQGPAQPVPLNRLVLSMARALDLARPESPRHHLRVAYLSTCIARGSGLAGKDLQQLFLAAALHDIGITGRRDNIGDGFASGQECLPWHGEVAHQLLRNQPLLAGVAEIVRYHHLPWSAGRGQQCNGEPVPPASNVIALAEEVDRAIRTGVDILTQSRDVSESIFAGAGRQFRPELVEAFRLCATKEAFWLDLASGRIGAILLENADWPCPDVGEVTLGSFAEILGRVVDGLSAWTATHSAGVAGVCAALAGLLKFSPSQRFLLRAAGYFHDLGKLSVRPVILDSPEQLSWRQRAVIRGHPYHTLRILEGMSGPPQLSEWAGLHHERLDGTGYPFGRRGGQLTLGSRVTAVADAFTALAEDRPHRKAMSVSGAISVLEGLADGGQLDGDMVGLLSVHRDAVVATGEQEKLVHRLRHHGLGEYVADAEAG